jgi:hypothetical protein
MADRDGFPLDEMGERLARVRSAMVASGLDACVVLAPAGRDLSARNPRLSRMCDGSDSRDTCQDEAEASYGPGCADHHRPARRREVVAADLHQFAEEKT